MTKENKSSKYNPILVISLVALATVLLVFLLIYLFKFATSKTSTDISSDNNALINDTPIVTPRSATGNNGGQFKPVSVFIDSARRASLVFDLNPSKMCKGLELSAEVPASTTLTSDLGQSQACVSVTLENPDYKAYVYVGENGNGCADMQTAVEIGGLSNGKKLYRTESYEDYNGLKTADLVYSYHTYYYKGNGACEGSTGTADLTKYSGLFVSCLKNKEVCDGVVKTLLINDVMN